MRPPCIVITCIYNEAAQTAPKNHASKPPTTLLIHAIFASILPGEPKDENIAKIEK